MFSVGIVPAWLEIVEWVLAVAILVFALSIFIHPAKARDKELSKQSSSGKNDSRTSLRERLSFSGLILSSFVVLGSVLGLGIYSITGMTFKTFDTADEVRAYEKSMNNTAFLVGFERENLEQRIEAETGLNHVTVKTSEDSFETISSGDYLWFMGYERDEETGFNKDTVGQVRFENDRMIVEFVEVESVNEFFDTEVFSNPEVESRDDRSILKELSNVGEVKEFSLEFS